MRTTNAVELIASRSGDAFFGYFLSLGQKVTRRLRRRNSHARQGRKTDRMAPSQRATPAKRHKPPNDANHKQATTLWERQQ
ncbi:hypothetical protein [Cupriavidus necator]|uniref:hypothetical protein n=1 Tax=Cupriavidus necator TaxID=106590 RepID=UPI00115FCE64|nr:hypothetical protein [Cupriavidus necator]